MSKGSLTSLGVHSTPKTNFAQAAIILAKLNVVAQKDTCEEGEAMYVLGKNGIKITL